MRKPTRSPIAIAFGHALRDARRNAHLSRTAVADCADIDRTYPAKLECGESEPKLGTFIRLARAVEMTPAALLAETLASLKRIESKQPIKARVAPTVGPGRESLPAEEAAMSNRNVSGFIGVNRDAPTVVAALAEEKRIPAQRIGYPAIDDELVPLCKGGTQIGSGGSSQ